MCQGVWRRNLFWYTLPQHMAWIHLFLLLLSQDLRRYASIQRTSRPALKIGLSKKKYLMFIWFVYVFVLIPIITMSLETCFVRQICFYISIFLLPFPWSDRGGRRSHKHIYRVWLMMAWERFNPSPGGFLGPAWLIFKPIVWLTSLATPCLSSPSEYWMKPPEYLQYLGDIC